MNNNIELDISKLTLGSSSKGKLDEYQGFNLPFPQEVLPDAPEVLGSEEDVIIYKSLHFGDNFLVEDTSLEVEGESVGVNIKWLIKELHGNPKFQHKKAFWSVYLGVVQSGILYIVRARVSGVIHMEKKVEDAFGFDSVFVPEGSSSSLWELKQMGIHEKFSARKLAVDKLLRGDFDKIIKASLIPEWKGSYQK